MLCFSLQRLLKRSDEQLFEAFTKILIGCLYSDQG